MQRAVGGCAAAARPGFPKRPARFVTPRVCGVGPAAMARCMPKKREEGPGRDGIVADRPDGHTIAMTTAQRAALPKSEFARRAPPIEAARIRLWH